MYSHILPLCGKKIVNTQYRRVWEKFDILGIRMFPTVYVQNSKQCSGASTKKTGGKGSAYFTKPMATARYGRLDDVTSTFNNALHG